MRTAETNQNKGVDRVRLVVPWKLTHSDPWFYSLQRDCSDPNLSNTMKYRECSENTRPVAPRSANAHARVAGEFVEAPSVLL